MVNSSLYCWSRANASAGVVSWIRMSSAMIPARKNMTSDVIM